MIKRIPALFFILLANVVLLAHAVIPHHHHGEEVCIVSSHCEFDGEAHEHDDAEHNHEHNGADNIDDCALQQILISPPAKVRHEIKSLDLDNDLFHKFHLQALLIENRLVIDSYLSFRKTEPPILYFTYQNYAGKVSGLRAPPVV